MYIVSSINIQNLLSLTASAEVATFEASYLQNPLGSARWRTTSMTPYVEFEFASSLPIDCATPLYTNAQSGDQFRFRGATSQANLTASPVIDPGLIDVWPASADLSEYDHSHGRQTFNSGTVSWGRFDFDFTGNTDAYVEVGAIFAGQRFTPGCSFMSDWPATEQLRTVYESNLGGGGMSRGGGISKRPVVFVLPALTLAERVTLAHMERDSRGVLPVMVVLDPDENTYPQEFIYYGYMSVEFVELDFLASDGSQAWQATITIIEP